MSNLRMTIMLKMLARGGRGGQHFQKAQNKVIQKLYLKDDALHFVFDDGYHIKLWDDGQSCCEDRYMRTDDELNDFIGSTLLDAAIKEGPEIEEKYDVHETEFLIIKTSIGEFTMTSHNEHNGYYGDFWIRCDPVEDS